MRDYMTIGSTPSGEDCAQVGSDNYYPRMKIESKAFINQLFRKFGESPYGALLVTKSFPHDFGEYHEVCVLYNDENEEALDYACKLESECPEYWDEEAIKELKSHGLVIESNANVDTVK